MASKYYSWTHGRVHYQKRGMGDPLLLVHDIYPGASHEEFSRNIDALSRRFTIYAIDLLGFGQSDHPRHFYNARTYAELIFDFLREEIASSAYVVTSGLSAAYAATGVTWEDEWYRKLIFLSPRTTPTGINSAPWLAAIRRRLLTLGGGQYDINTDNYALKQFLHQHFFHPKEVTEDRVTRLRDNAKHPGSTYPYASLITRYLDGDLLQILPRISVPILILCGKQSRGNTLADTQQVLAASRHGRLEIIDQAGIWAHAEQSAKVNSLMADFLEGPRFGQ